MNRSNNLISQARSSYQENIQVNDSKVYPPRAGEHIASHI